MSDDAKFTPLDSTKLTAQIRFNDEGLIPAITQQFDTGEVLMMAWMNQETLQETLQSGRVCYWSRSRKAFWRKGDTSGHTQHLKGCYLDCDGDTLLVLVDQKGAACHEGTRTCFSRHFTADGRLQPNPTIWPDKTRN